MNYLLSVKNFKFKFSFFYPTLGSWYPNSIWQSITVFMSFLTQRFNVFNLCYFLRF